MTLSGSRATGANAASVSSGQPEPFAMVVGSPSHYPSLLRQSSIPSARTANASGHGPWSPARDRTIMVVKTLGRCRWKKVSGYHRQGRVEHTCFRDTSILGEGLRARSPAGQGSEAVLGCEILNRMTALGRPVSYRLDRGGSCRWASCGPVTIRATTPLADTGDG